MTDLEDAVRAALIADAERVIPDGAVAASGRRKSHVPLLAAAVVVAVAVVVTVVAAATQTAGQRRAPVTSQAGRTATVEGLDFRLPAAARFVSPTFITGAGNIEPEGWIVNQTPGPQCHKVPGGSQCGSPVQSLDDRQYEVAFTDLASPARYVSKPTTTIAGYPATVTERPATINVPRGAAHVLRVLIYLGRSGTPENVLQVQATFGSSDADLVGPIKGLILDAHRHRRR